MTLCSLEAGTGLRLRNSGLRFLAPLEARGLGNDALEGIKWLYSAEEAVGESRTSLTFATNAESV